MKVLIRDGAGEGNILRFKFDETISRQSSSLVRFRDQAEATGLAGEIGHVAKILVTHIFSAVPGICLISLRPKQVIVHLEAGNQWWSEDDENKIKAAIETIFHNRGTDISWSVQRRVGETPTPL